VEEPPVYAGAVPQQANRRSHDFVPFIALGMTIRQETRYGATAMASTLTSCCSAGPPIW